MIGDVWFEEEDAHRDLLGIDRAAGQALGFTHKKLSRQGGEDSGAIAGAGIRIECAAMLQVDQRFDAQLQNLVAGAAILIGDKTDAAIAAIKLRLIRLILLLVHRSPPVLILSRVYDER